MKSTEKDFRMLEPDFDVLFNMWFKQPVYATGTKRLQNFRYWFDNKHVSLPNCIRDLRRDIITSALFGIEHKSQQAPFEYTFGGLFEFRPDLLPVVDRTILKLLNIKPVVTVSEKRWFTILPDWDKDYLMASCRIDFQKGGQK